MMASALVSDDSLYLAAFPVWGPCYFSSLMGFRSVIDFWFINILSCFEVGCDDFQAL